MALFDSLVGILVWMAAVIGLGRILRGVWALDPAPTPEQVAAAAGTLTDPFEIAFLKGGITEVLFVLAEDLHRAGFLRLKDGRLQAVSPEGQTAPEDPLAAELLGVIHDLPLVGGSATSDRFMGNMAAHRGEDLIRSLRVKGLWSSENACEKAFFLRFVALFAASVPAGLHLFFAYGAVAGGSREYPLESYAASLLIGVASCALFVLLADPKASPLGKAVTRSLPRGADNPELSGLRVSFRKKPYELLVDMTE